MAVAPSTHQPTEEQLRRARRWVLGVRVLLYGTLLVVVVAVLALRHERSADGAPVHVVKGLTDAGNRIDLRVSGGKVVGVFSHGVDFSCVGAPGPPELPDLSLTHVPNLPYYLLADERSFIDPGGLEVDRRYRLEVHETGDRWAGFVRYDLRWLEDASGPARCHADEHFALPR